MTPDPCAGGNKLFRVDGLVLVRFETNVAAPDDEAAEKLGFYLGEHMAVGKMMIRQAVVHELRVTEQVKV